MRKIIFFLQQSWLLMVSAFVFGLLIAAAYMAWSPNIEANKRLKFEGSVAKLIPGTISFEKTLERLEITTQKEKVEYTDVYKAVDANGETLGWAFEASGSGFADRITVVVAFDPNADKLLGFEVLATNETPGFGSKISEDYFRTQFVGAPTEPLELVKVGEAKTIDSKIVSITGATVSSDAVVNIFNDYVDDIRKKLKEGS